MSGGPQPLPPDDPLLAPPYPGPGQPYPQYQPYGPYQPYSPYQPQGSPADQDFQIHWPRSTVARVGVVVLGGLTAWLCVKGQFELGVGIFGNLMMLLGLKGNAQTAALNAAQAVVTARRVARDVSLTKEAVRDIQNNPAQGGTPGQMHRVESGQGPPFANL